MTEPFLGEIRLFTYPNLIPKGWLECAGQILAIQQNAALFSLLGTTFGGNGVSTFALPDLRGRVALGLNPGQNSQGEQAGTESVTLLSNQIGSHNHQVNVSSKPGTSGSGVDQYLAADAASGVAAQISVYASGSGSLTPLAATTVQPNSGGQPHENRQPSLALLYCIATSGVFPSRG